MRAIRTSLFALAVASLAVAGCSPAKSGAYEPVKKIDAAKFEASIDAMKAAPFKFKAEGIDQIDGVIAALPKEIKVTHEPATFDAATGATAITNVKISPADNPNIGVQIQQIRLWGFDEALATARLNGQRLDETAPLARRVEVTGAAAFGLAELMNPVMDAYTGAIDEATEGFAPPSPPMNFKRYDLSMGRLILDDVVLRPYVLTSRQLDPENEFAEVFPMLQAYAAAYRSFAADTYASYETKAELIFEEGGLEQAILIALDTSGTKGWRGADVDFSFLRGMRFDFNMLFPVNEFADLGAEPQDPFDALNEDPEAPAEPVENATDDPEPDLETLPRRVRLTGGLERGTHTNVRLDKLLGFLARGEMPPRTEADLLSLGALRMEKQSFVLNEAEVYSVADATIDFSGFHWFIPTKARIGANDVVYNIQGLMDGISSIDPEAFAALKESEPNVEKVMQTLAKYALDKPSFDYDIGWTWDEKSGDAKVDMTYGLDQFIRMTMTYAGGFPSFDAVSALIPEKNPEQADQAAISKLFTDKSTIKSLTVDVADEGGLEKGFGLAVEMAKLMPPGDPATGFLQSSTPESLRTMASSGIYMAGSQAGAEIPAVKAALDAVAGFIAKGGKLSLKLAPKEPVLWSSLQESAANPQGTFERLGYSVQHVAPPEPKAAKKQ